EHGRQSTRGQTAIVGAGLARCVNTRRSRCSISAQRRARRGAGNSRRAAGRERTGRRDRRPVLRRVDGLRAPRQRKTNVGLAARARRRRALSVARRAGSSRSPPARRPRPPPRRPSRSTARALLARPCLRCRLARVLRVEGARRAGFEVVLALVATYAALPMWVAEHPAIQDLPQHMAAIRVLGSYGDPDLAFAQYFTIDLTRTQYLAY